MCVHQCRTQGKVRLVQGGREIGPEALGPQLPVGDVPLSPARPAALPLLRQAAADQLRALR